MYINKGNDPQNVFDRHFALTCPHCGVRSDISAISIPRYEFLYRFKPTKVGVVYRCDSCNAPIFLRFNCSFSSPRPGKDATFHIDETYEEVERAQESFEFRYLPQEVEADFREALVCYAAGAPNGFGAMCRRTVQSVSGNLGAESSDKVLNELRCC